MKSQSWIFNVSLLLRIWPKMFLLWRLCTHLLTHEQQHSTHHHHSSLSCQSAFLLHVHVKDDNLLFLYLTVNLSWTGDLQNQDRWSLWWSPRFRLELKWSQDPHALGFALLSSNTRDSAICRAGSSYIPSGHGLGRLAPAADVEVRVHLHVLDLHSTGAQMSIMNMMSGEIFF